MHRHYAPLWRLAIVVLLGALVASCGTATAALQTVEPSVAFERASDPDVIVLDVRTPEEFAAGHLADAVNIDFYAADFADRIAALDPDASYVLYCRSGNRSGATLPLMDDLGFADVLNVDGGIIAWVGAGLPIE